MSDTQGWRDPDGHESAHPVRGGLSILDIISEACRWKPGGDEDYDAVRHRLAADLARALVVFEKTGEHRYPKLGEYYLDGGTVQIVGSMTTPRKGFIVRPVSPTTDRPLDPMAQKNRMIGQLLEQMRQGEGTSITINHPNPSFDGPNEVVEAEVHFGVDDDCQRRFEGDTLVECLEEAKVWIEERP